MWGFGVCILGHGIIQLLSFVGLSTRSQVVKNSACDFKSTIYEDPQCLQVVHIQNVTAMDLSNIIR